MRLVLVGGGSFIARHVYREALDRRLDTACLPHDGNWEADLAATDVVVNFAAAPEIFTGPINEPDDWDGRVARAAAAAGAWFAMCSTRRVYAADTRFGATETDDACGDETFYGRNKAAGERMVVQAMGARHTIFRLSNIFGFEYGEERRRRSFFGQMLGTLHRENRISFDMSPDTRRDFLPVQDCARAILDGLSIGLTGAVNLGCGFPVRCGSVAEWLIEGFGAGQLVADSKAKRDEFFLDMAKWRLRFPPLTNEGALRRYCLELGRRLRNA